MSFFIGCLLGYLFGMSLTYALLQHEKKMKQKKLKEAIDEIKERIRLETLKGKDVN